MGMVSYHISPYKIFPFVLDSFHELFETFIATIPLSRIEKRVMLGKELIIKPPKL